MDASLEEQIAKTLKLLGDPHGCGWVNCTKQFNGESPPPGWMLSIRPRGARNRRP